MTEQVFALLAGGGTGGHTYPAIAVAQELQTRGHTVRFVGGKRGIEGRVVPAAGFEIDLLPGRGLQRRLTLDNIGAIWGAFTAFLRAISIVRRYRPRVVVGFGGYASLPCVVAARLWRVPVVIHEQDAAPGLANRIGVRLGARPAVSLPGTPLPNATLTGNPVRASIAAIERKPELDPALLGVFGGAQGARTINHAALGCYDCWRDRTDLVVHHVCGPRQSRGVAGDAGRTRVGRATRCATTCSATTSTWTRCSPRAALAVCRSGAGTIAELTAAGLPAVLVPLPGAPSDHQTRNAQTLERSGAAVLLPDGECNAKALAALVTDLLAQPAKLDEMSLAARRVGPPRRGCPRRRSRRGACACLTRPFSISRNRVASTSSGVAGAGMSAIALLLARMGHTVSGSDIKTTTVMERLAAAGVDVHVGNRPEYVPAAADAVVYSTAVPRSNVELRTAEERGIPVLHRAVALAALSAIRTTLAVAGSHGKTTTSSMLALILRARRLAAELRHRRRCQRGRHATRRTAKANGSSSKPTRATARSFSSHRTPRS